MLNSLTVSDPQEGHFFGNKNFLLSFGLFFESIESMWGITSPALSITAVSPILISFLFISSSLWSVAFETTTPPIFIRFNFCYRVNAPVLPTWISISSILEIALLDENLWAIAHLGALATLPNLFCIAKSLTL